MLNLIKRSELKSLMGLEEIKTADERLDLLITGLSVYIQNTKTGELTQAQIDERPDLKLATYLTVSSVFNKRGKENVQSESITEGSTIQFDDSMIPQLALSIFNSYQSSSSAKKITLDTTCFEEKIQNLL